MALRLIYVTVSKLLSWTVLRTRSDTAKEVEILVLRQRGAQPDRALARLPCLNLGLDARSWSTTSSARRRFRSWSWPELVAANTRLWIDAAKAHE
jgi:hypothetical protein